MQRFIQLIYNHTGLYIRKEDTETLYNKIYARMKLLNFSSPEKYYQLLNTSNYQGTSSDSSKREWQELIVLLTTGESYFFRDRRQFNLLKNQILPKLLNPRIRAHYEGEAKPSLRIWSAGCSTGEETYSLAILVKELIPDYDSWNILILGTDINPEAIKKAKRGIYASWSFRSVDIELQRCYFHSCAEGWEVNEQIRNMVTFHSGNLIKEYFPNYTSDIHNFDIILCRNVFIYFDAKSISVVLKKFYNILQPGGCLITGHAELYSQNLEQLQPLFFAESVVYQRSEDLHVETLVSKSVSPATIPNQDPMPLSVFISHSQITRSYPTETTSANLTQAETLFHKGNYKGAIEAGLFHSKCRRYMVRYSANSV